MVKIDLHTHSTRSDGLDTPSQLIENAANAGISVIALTDHDTVSGWDEARHAAAKHGIGFVPGIEVTSVSEVERLGRTIRLSVHLLAYLTDPDHKALSPFRLACVTITFRALVSVWKKTIRFGVPVTEGNFNSFESESVAKPVISTDVTVSSI